MNQMMLTTKSIIPLITMKRTQPQMIIIILWMYTSETSKIIKSHNKCCTKKLDYTKNASQDHSNKLLDLVKHCHAFHLTINHPQLLIKANLNLALSRTPNLEIAALLTHTMESSSLIDSLAQKVLSLDKQVANLYKCHGELKYPATASGNQQPKPPPPEQHFHGSASTTPHSNASNDKTTPYQYQPKCPMDPSEMCIYKGQVYCFCPKCLIMVAGNSPIILVTTMLLMQKKLRLL